MNKEPFVGTIYTCSECEGEMQSKYPGHWCACECGKSYVDQTRHYCRLGGAIKWDKPEVEEEDED